MAHDPPSATPPSDPGVGRDPADTGGLDLEAIWALCEPAPGAQPPDPLLGRTFDGVRLERVLGEGGMGRVYEGRREGNGGKVAVKVLRPGLWSRDLVRRFAKESEILRRLDHPGISRIEAVTTCDILGTPVPAIVMEHVPGARPITTYVRDEGLGPERIAELMAEVCDAVAQGHAQGIVHRDLKPGNVLVSESGAPKVIDFGVARGRSAAVPDSTLTAPGGLVGTLQYMSPEQVDSGGTVADARSDVHALGAILHELLAGSPPYDVAGLPLVEAARVIRETRVPRLTGLPPGIAATVERALAKDPAKRHADSGALAAALRDPSLSAGWIAPAPPAAPPRTSTPRAPAVDRDQAGPPAPQAPAAGRSGEMVRGALAGLAIGLVLLAAVQLVRDWRSFDRFRAESRAGLLGLADRFRGGESLVFEHAFRTVEQFDAQRFVVSNDGMRKWDEPFSDPRVLYWGPAKGGVPATLVWRFEFPVAAERIELRARTQCWDFGPTPDQGAGRGAAAVAVSGDGEHWIVLHDSIAAGRWGESWASEGDLPAEVTGSRELWLRVTLLTEGADADDADEYTVAQFARAHAGSAADVFALRVWARGGMPERAGR